MFLSHFSFIVIASAVERTNEKKTLLTLSRRQSFFLIGVSVRQSIEILIKEKSSNQTVSQLLTKIEV